MRLPGRTPAAVGIGALVVLTLAACTPGTSLPSVPTSSPSPTPTAAGPSVSIIAGLAQREVGEGTVVAVEDESDGAEWEVHVVASDGTEQQVHLAADGSVLAGPSEEPTNADQQSANRALVAAASVTLATAQRKMLGAVPGGRVTEIELLHDADGRIAWQGDVLVRGVRHDVRIDGVNAAVLRNQADAAATPAPSTGS